MIETEQTVTVNCNINSTWTYAKDFQRWASIMPGYQSCEMEDEDNSLWVLKVGVGAMVRTVKVKVCVVDWAGPERVDFTYKLLGDPVEGNGSYIATPAGSDQTAMTLKVRIVGSGPLAPMWEAMCGPVLPKFARSFAEQLKGRIEEFNDASAATTPTPTPSAKIGLFGRFTAWLRRCFGRA
ncbi:CoxG family protein [Novosphingobium sp. M1R2S20]|uniref:CoxG family protein n=1 Tax=Novosphingobium rhizovicinum TaxID=3228928 RepID=A0ABV3RFP3_9SPHN